VIEMKLQIAFLFMLSASLAVSGGTASELEQLVNGLQTKYQRLHTLTADFTQIYNAPGERLRRESGKLQLKKPGKMRWDYTTPETKLYVSDGKTIYEYIPADRSATRMRAKETDDWRAPFMFLLGRGNLRRDFKRIEFASEAPLRAGHRVLRMIPKRSSDIRELLIEVEPKSLSLTRLSLLKQGNARIDFLLSNVRENVALADAVFAFNPPAGIAIRQQ
jgi:outer membrane lipoprotein carrier protein